MSSDPYHKRPEWSYSQMKKIISSGIDYAVWQKNEDVGIACNKAINTGTFVHQVLLGGEDTFVVAPFKGNYATNEEGWTTKAKREWRDAQSVAIINDEQFDGIIHIADRIKSHKFASELLMDDAKHEVELYATIDGVNIRGKADAVKYHKDGKIAIVTDLKTTAQFDEFKYRSFRNHYDLQAAVYTNICGNPDTMNYYFVVAETVEPYRVQVMHASMAFLENGERKLKTCLDEIKGFGTREVSFNIEEVIELGDMSL